jgi:hypothetical protein
MLPILALYWLFLGGLHWNFLENILFCPTKICQYFYFWMDFKHFCKIIKDKEVFLFEFCVSTKLDQKSCTLWQYCKKVPKIDYLFFCATEQFTASTTDIYKLFWIIVHDSLAMVFWLSVKNGSPVWLHGQIMERARMDVADTGFASCVITYNERSNF